MTTASSQRIEPGTGLWSRALRRLQRDRLGMTGAAVVAIYLLLAVLAWLGWVGADWSATSDDLQSGASARHWLGTNAIGQDIMARALYSTRVAFEVGFLVAIISALLGTALGGIAGYWHNRWPDVVISWLMGVLDSIPFYLFVAAFAYALKGYPLAMHIAMIAVFWTSVARSVRAEAIKLKHAEYIDAARALGVNQGTILLRHLLPNTSHVVLVQSTLTFIAAIKTEVILSFLGIGIQNGISWGLMISEATLDIQAGHFANFIVASSFLFVLVIAFNLFADALQDALDPRMM